MAFEKGLLSMICGEAALAASSTLGRLCRPSAERLSTAPFSMGQHMCEGAACAIEPVIEPRSRFCLTARFSGPDCVQ
mgnify:CR=1 FL=1